MERVSVYVCDRVYLWLFYILLYHRACTGNVHIHTPLKTESSDTLKTQMTS